MESNVTEAFNKVKNRLREHYAEDIIFKCIETLNHPNVTSIQRMRYYPPWLLLLLLRWTLVYGNFDRSLRFRKPLSDNNFNRLVNRLHDLNGSVKLPSEYDNLFLFLRNMAFQEFWMQDEAVLLRFARQSILFGHLDVGHPFQKGFLENTGINIETFIDFALILISTFVSKNVLYVIPSWFSSTEPYYPNEATEKFLATISKDQKSIQEYLNTQAKIKNLNYQYYEPSPLRRYPMLKHEEKYYCYSPNLLFYSLQTFIYDFLKESDANKFMDKFGAIFEKYVDMSLRYADISFYTEENLRSILGTTTSKLVDFLISDPQGNILIDAKGVELSTLGMVSDDRSVIADKAKTSILKGITQAFETLKSFHEAKEAQNSVLNLGNKYLLVVTFKEFYIGNGRSFYDSIAKKEIDEIIIRYGNQEWIPLDNMYFLSIDDLDLLVESIKNKKVNLVALLEQAIDADKDIRTRKLIFRQHIEAYSELALPQYLEDEIDSLFNRLKGVLKD